MPSRAVCERMDNASSMGKRTLRHSGWGAGADGHRSCRGGADRAGIIVRAAAGEPSPSENSGATIGSPLAAPSGSRRSRAGVRVDMIRRYCSLRSRGVQAALERLLSAVVATP